jgi:hypothetical protein
MANGTTREYTSKTERRFYNAEGKESARAQPDTIRAVITFLGDDGGVIEAKQEDFNDGVRNAGWWFGWSTSVTNAAGGTNPNATPYERALDRSETLSGEDGEWQGEREGGPQIGLIVEAAVSLGYDEAQVRNKFKSGEITAAQLLKNAAIEAKVLELKEAKLAQRRKSAMANASAAAGALKDLLGPKAS